VVGLDLAGRNHEWTLAVSAAVAVGWVLVPGFDLLTALGALSYVLGADRPGHSRVQPQAGGR